MKPRAPRKQIYAARQGVFDSNRPFSCPICHLRFNVRNDATALFCFRVSSQVYSLQAACVLISPCSKCAPASSVTRTQCTDALNCTSVLSAWRRSLEARTCERICALSTGPNVERNEAFSVVFYTRRILYRFVKKFHYKNHPIYYARARETLSVLCVREELHEQIRCADRLEVITLGSALNFSLKLTAFLLMLSVFQ